MLNLTPRNIGIALTALATAALHLAAALDMELFPEGPDPLFILNSIGFVGLLGAYLLPIPFFQKRHDLVRKGLIVFAIITLLAWFFIWVIQYVIIAGVPFFSRDSWYGVPAKISEIILVALLWTAKPEGR